MIRRAPGASEVRAYDISGRKLSSINANLTIGSGSAAAQKRARRRYELENTETELIQDFAFPTVSNRIKVSADGRYVFATGTYPPQIHVYDTEELSLKFKRHVVNDIIDFQILDEDWRKFGLLTADRYVDVHSQFGSHFKTRVPRHGRDLMLHRGTCDLYVCGEGPEVWRLNLDQGRFMAPLPTNSGVAGGNNVCGINPVNMLLAFGGESALLDIWDPRVAGASKKPAATLDVGRALSESFAVSSKVSPEICSLRFDETDGITMAVGMSTGQCLLFDLRSPDPIRIRDQGNGLPIRSLRMHRDGKHCISADPKSIKVWDRTSGTNVVAIEPDSDLNHLCLVGNSGVMCTAVETQRVKTYYVPALGPAPKWCAFLDNFTEELEMDNQKNTHGASNEEEVYENYKFVSHDDLDSLGLAHLIGTDLLKAYMHGYFVHQKLYRRAVDVSEPFAYEKYKKEKARAKLESERESRISKVRRGAKKQVSVNQKMLESLDQRQGGSKKGTTQTTSVADDERFSAMFTNKDYAVEEDAERFQFLYPSGTGQKKRQDNSDNSDQEYLERFELVDEGGNENEGVRNEGGGFLSSSDEAGDEDSDSEGTKERQSEAPPLKDDDSEDGIRKTKNVKRRAPKMYTMGRLGETVRARDRLHTSGSVGDVQQRVRQDVSLGARIAAKSTTDAHRNAKRNMTTRTQRTDSDKH